MSKYRAIKTTIDNITFDSRREAARYLELKAMERVGEIIDLELQPVFKYMADNEFGHKKDKCLFKYIADFSYYKKGENLPTIEDCKGFKTPVYRLKKKLIEDRFGIKIIET